MSCLTVQPDDLRHAVLEILNNRLSPRLTLGVGMDLQLKSAVEGLAYEDWTITYENVGLVSHKRIMVIRSGGLLEQCFI